MGRYRPPQKPGSNYITPNGEKTLREELDYLWRTKRPEVTRAVSEAAAQGDRSENAEYIYGKKQLREIDRRVRFLRKRLEHLKVVSEKPSDTSRIFFGAWVELEDDDGNTYKYRLVGPDEFNLKMGLLSIDSPMARALLKKQVDDEIVTGTDEHRKNYFIISINYD